MGNLLQGIFHLLGNLVGTAYAPTTPSYPGEKQFVQDQSKAHPNVSPQEWGKSYRQAVQAPGFSGNYYKGASPSPVPSHPMEKYFPVAYGNKPSSSEADLTNQIRQGFLRFNPQTPAATLAASFARAGKGLPDPLMPAVLALKETGGGMHMANPNNLLNILYSPQTNNAYEKPEYGIEGGGGHQGFPGVIRSGLYDKYLRSGNLQDFFPTYTPSVDQQGHQINDPYEKQMNDYNLLRHYFVQ